MRLSEATKKEVLNLPQVGSLPFSEFSQTSAQVRGNEVCEDRLFDFSKTSISLVVGIVVVTYISAAPTGHLALRPQHSHLICV